MAQDAPGLSGVSTATVGALVHQAARYAEAKDWAAAAGVLRCLLERGQHTAPVYAALGMVLMQLGRTSHSLQCCRQALTLDPTSVPTHDRLILLLDVQPETTFAEAQAERRRWWAQHGAAFFEARQPHTNNRDPERPLRVGYVSGDFKFHSVALAVHRLILRHSAAMVPFYYSSVPPHLHDVVTADYQQRPGWRDVSGLTDGALADCIRRDRIDILVDLSGYTPFNRLLAFCREPAPIQATAWGYATGVGWPAMHYLFSDPIAIPAADRCSYVERVVDLPSVMWYDLFDHVVPANRLPCLDRAPTFGVFQRPIKLNEPVLALWAALLRRLPESRLIFKDATYTPDLCAWIRDVMGDTARQLEFRGGSPYSDHLAAYHDVDLTLDPFPQTGGVTSCETLRMGVPPVTLMGDRMIQRTTASFLTILGLTDFIATTPEHYVDLAVTWVTTRRHELADLREGLRARLAASPICAGYLPAVEAVYRSLWREWCAQGDAAREA